MRYKEKENIKNKVKSYNNVKVPMKYFTPEDMKPSEQTLNLIRQIAYTYKVFKNSGKPQVYCLN